MRYLMPLLLWLAVGCQHCPRLLDCSAPCPEKEVVIDCPKETVECPPTHARQRKTVS